MKFKDYYKILGVERTASSIDIKKAYHRLSKVYHPDLSPGNPFVLDKFQEITEAYNVLGNLDSRLEYAAQLDKRFHIVRENLENISTGKP